MGKAQASMDFLFSYGWAIILILVVLFAFFFMGVFDFSNSLGTKVSGFSDVGVIDWKLSKDGVFALQLQNKLGRPVKITSITAELGDKSITWSGNMTLSVGKKSNPIDVGYFLFDVPKEGTGYTVQIMITYKNMDSDWHYLDKGTVTGKVGNLD